MELPQFVGALCSIEYPDTFNRPLKQPDTLYKMLRFIARIPCRILFSIPHLSRQLKVLVGLISAKYILSLFKFIIHTINLNI